MNKLVWDEKHYVEGRPWLDKDEFDYLLSIADELIGNGCIVELGTFRSGTTELLAGRCKTSVWSIDNYAVTDKWIEVYDDYSPVVSYRRYFENKYNNVFFIVGDSLNVGKCWDKKIELLYLDADHGYDITKQNFIEWSKNIVDGGWVLFHDVNLFPALVGDILNLYTDYEYVGIKSRLEVIRKKI